MRLCSQRQYLIKLSIVQLEGKLSCHSFMMLRWNVTHHVMSLDDCTLQGLENAVWYLWHASPGRSLAEWQLDTPRALSSSCVSTQAKISSSDYCQEMINKLVGGHRMNTWRQDTAYIGVSTTAALKYRQRHFLRCQVTQGTEVVSSHK